MNELPIRETENGTVVQQGECRYCGQMHAVQSLTELSEEELTAKATAMCDCDEAIAETKRMDGINLAEKNIESLLGKYAFAEHLKPFAYELAANHLDSIQVKVDNVTATMSVNNDGKIILKKKRTEEDTLEA